LKPNSPLHFDANERTLVREAEFRFSRLQYKLRRQTTKVLGCASTDGWPCQNPTLRQSLCNRARLHRLLKKSALNALYQGTTSPAAEKVRFERLVTEHDYTGCGKSPL